VSTSSDYDDTLDDPDTIGTLVLEQRATTNQQIWTTSLKAPSLTSSTQQMPTMRTGSKS